MAEWKQPRNDRPHKVTERDRSRQRSADATAAQFQNSSGVNIRAKAASHELRAVGDDG